MQKFKFASKACDLGKKTVILFSLISPLLSSQKEYVLPIHNEIKAYELYPYYVNNYSTIVCNPSNVIVVDSSAQWEGFANIYGGHGKFEDLLDGVVRLTKSVKSRIDTSRAIIPSNTLMKGGECMGKAGLIASLLKSKGYQPRIYASVIGVDGESWGKDVIPAGHAYVLVKAGEKEYYIDEFGWHAVEGMDDVANIVAGRLAKHSKDLFIAGYFYIGGVLVDGRPPKIYIISFELPENNGEEWLKIFVENKDLGERREQNTEFIKRYWEKGKVHLREISAEEMGVEER